jgi:hypothetical protein
VAPAAPAARRKVADSRGDIMMVMPDTMVVADVSVVHPAAPTYAAGAAAKNGAAVAAQDRTKCAHYMQAGDGDAYDLVPLSVESFGRLGKPAMCLLNALADVAASSGGVWKSAFVTSAFRRLSVPLCRRNGYGESLFSDQCSRMPAPAAGVPARAARAGGGVSFSAAALVCRGACGAVQCGVLTCYVQLGYVLPRALLSAATAALCNSDISQVWQT